MTMLKRTIMTLYSGDMDIYSHQVRIVLAEKGVNVDIINVDDNHPCKELLELNPYNTLPTLVDRELVLYQAHDSVSLFLCLLVCLSLNGCVS